MVKRILITGASGTVGREVVRQLCEKRAYGHFLTDSSTGREETQKLVSTFADPAN